ncbi:MAG: DNA replication and repair protein RecF [Actinomycetota bacterium]|nr:DNA replication and repair protein RecF [Actinomycetota bacterium]
MQRSQLSQCRDLFGFVAVVDLKLTDFRCFAAEAVAPHPEGLTVLRGPNGAGKSSVLEAVYWLASGRSWRTSSRSALVRSGTDRAVVRADLMVGSRSVVVEAELPQAGPARVQVNRQSLVRRGAMADVLRVVLFAPDDLALVHGAPAGRRDMLDDVLVGRHPRFDALEREVERTLRQRAALLQQAGGRLDSAATATLDVWDARLARAGTDLVEARETLVADLATPVAAAHRRIAGPGPQARMTYRRSWEGDLAAALAGARAEDVRRRSTSVGPHRDDVDLWLDERPARTHASQGEQRSLALALRLGTYHLAVADGGPAPVLLLDDVFSELDAARAEALVAELPAGQVLLTTAVDPPGPVVADLLLDVRDGAVVAEVSR